jgi:DNA polymerase-3 subunit beta
MKITIDREQLLKPLLRIGGVVERRQTLPILGNILIGASDRGLELTATDLEVQLRTHAKADVSELFDFTLPARKFMDICRALPEGANIELEVSGEKAVLRSGRSRFTLGLLPAADFPAIEPSSASETITIDAARGRELIEKTQFAMAQQDVRYYLNGMLLQIEDRHIRGVATDGHRLAMSDAQWEGTCGSKVNVILPRKAVMELGRLLVGEEGPMLIEVGTNHVTFEVGESHFTTKLIDGRFPDYQRVLPRDADKLMKVDREGFRQALTRASILSNEKYRGIRFSLSDGWLELQAHNPEQEEAEEELEVDYQGEALVIGFNVGYLLDVLGVVETGKVVMELKDGDSSCLIRGEGDTKSRYVVMPMRL